jgi:hypothetical protein
VALDGDLVAAGCDDGSLWLWEEAGAADAAAALGGDAAGSGSHHGRRPSRSHSRKHGRSGTDSGRDTDQQSGGRDAGSSSTIDGDQEGSSPSTRCLQPPARTDGQAAARAASDVDARSLQQQQQQPGRDPMDLE